MSSLLPVLAPRLPGCPPAVDDRTYTKEHTEEEWESMRNVIRKLYIQENRKLNETMAILQARYGFAATEQMFKKRLKKWGLRKRTYRKGQPGSAASTPLDTTECSGTSTFDEQSSSSSSASPEEHQDDPTTSMALIQPSNTGPYSDLEQVLGGVFNWSQSKLEIFPVMSDPMSEYLATPNSPPIRDSRTMYRIFELVFDLWFHGKGDLAGMAARRGFYVLEFVLSDDHPDLIWHVLDTIYDMLRYCDYQSDEGRKYLCHLLRQAWLRNVNLLGQHIETSDAHRLWLYEQLIWDGRTRLRTSSSTDADQLRVEALRLEFTQMDVGDKKKAEELAINLLDLTRTEQGPRSNDRFHAYACKMLARVQESRQEWDTAEQNLRHAISKREVAHGANNNLRVIRDMWVLAAHYQKAGRQADANEITADALSRAQRYLEQDVE
ncbi:hypothetical protein FOC1_g10015593 [Fusarium oxysporum f. sp. cubense race 1]|uniref:Clr5 domain-containing protein n=1 Tax=Fusarium oxysporum f. sp. cubense (strain race 1) TaxID=1229664 RepID=N4TW31_FUSC1|nr:hypothetical protein FOC1_g10015593 [Fusarium oxysporum f. sp. cubense race 1]